MTTDKTLKLEWPQIKEHFQKRLEELRADNDRDLNQTETAELRGMIKLTKEILSLDEKKDHIKIDDTTYIE